MKAINNLVNEIKGHYKAITSTSSPYLIKDREKKIKSLKRDLKEYCFYKGYDYRAIEKQYNI